MGCGVTEMPVRPKITCAHTHRQTQTHCHALPEGLRIIELATTKRSPTTGHEVTSYLGCMAHVHVHRDSGVK